MSGDGMEDDYLYDGRTRMIKCEVSKCNHNCKDVCYYKDTYSANNCPHCKGLGCDSCEDITVNSIKSSIVFKRLKSLIHGFGINDADYLTQKKGETACKYYSTWKDMIDRCYSGRHKSYKECVVSEEWKYFSNFKKWMEKQDWKGMQLDKDLRFIGNKIYSKETCLFVTSEINGVLEKRISIKGENLQGTYKVNNRYSSHISICKRKKHLGYFDTEIEAHNCYLYAKSKYLKLLANKNSDNHILYESLNRHSANFLSRIITNPPNFLPHHNKAKIQEALDFCKGDKK